MESSKHSLSGSDPKQEKKIESSNRRDLAPQQG